MSGEGRARLKNRIGVVGAGSWGTTLAKILGDNGNETLLWARHDELCREINAAHENGRYLPGARLPRELTAESDLERVCRSCELVLLVVPSHGLRQVVRRMGEYLGGEQMIVHCTKGLEQETFRRMSEVIREETCVRKIGVLAGPNLAGELARANPAGTLVASKYDEVAARAQAALANRYFQVYVGRDVVGAEVGGAFKNVVALAAGMVDGLGLGDNTKALLVTRSLNEMAQLGAAMGASWVTFGGMAGIGDLMATSFSPLSRNHQVGERLARGESIEQISASMFMVAEGVKTTAAVRRFAAARGIEMPITEMVHAVLYEKVAFADALDRLIDRPVGREFAGFEATP